MIRNSILKNSCAFPAMVAAVLAWHPAPLVAQVLEGFQEDGSPAWSFPQEAEIFGAPPSASADEHIDPMVRDEVARLQDSGVIGLQSRIGTDLIAIERLQRRAEALRGLMSVLGTDGLRQFDPELYASMSNSPIFLSQRLEEIKLRREVDDELRGRRAEPGADVDAPPMPMDGSDIFSRPPFIGQLPEAALFGPGLQGFPGAPVATPPLAGFTPPGVTPPEGGPSEDQAGDAGAQQDPALSGQSPGFPPGFAPGFASGPDAVRPPEPEIDPAAFDIPVSLREIFGSNGVYRAVILHGTELLRVERGDTLPNDTEVLQILRDRIILRRQTREVEIHIRG